MKAIKSIKLLLIIMGITTGFAFAQGNTNPTENQEMMEAQSMKTYLIEREIPNAGELTQQELKGISQKSNDVVAEMGSQIEWLHSYVTDNKVYCIYRAQNEASIKQHAEKGGFPVNSIHELANKIDPSTADD